MTTRQKPAPKPVLKAVLKDNDLVFAVVQKITAAQRKGTLSGDLHVLARPRAVEVAHLTEDDVAWFTKNYPTEASRRVGMVPRRGKSKQRYDRMDKRLDLREKDGRFDYPPFVSYEVTALHEHTAFRGDFVPGAMSNPQWRCVWCSVALNKTEMRALGLLPPLVRKTKS